MKPTAKGKNIIKTVLFCLPLILYIVLFIAFEPYNYWGLRGDRGDLVSTIPAIRRILRSDCENIILGASKLAELKPEEVKALGLTDEDWVNLSIRGCTIEDECRLFWLAIENGKDVRKVIFLTSVNTSIWAGEGRVERELPLATNSSQYMFSPQTHLDTLKQIKDAILKKGSYAPNWINRNKSIDYYSGIEGDYGLLMRASPYNSKGADGVLQIIEYCKENDIELRIASLPLRKELYDFIHDNNRDLDFQFYSDFLANFTPVYVMEYPDSPWSQDTTFSNVGHYYGITDLHLDDYEEKYPMQMDIFRMMFQYAGEEVRVKSGELPVKEVFSVENIHLDGDGEQHIWAHEMPLEPNSFYIISCKGNMAAAAENGDLFRMDTYPWIRTDEEKDLDVYQDWLDFDLVYREGNDGIGWVAKRTYDLLFDDHQFRIVYEGEMGLDIENLTVYKYTGWKDENQAQFGIYTSLGTLLETIFKTDGSGEESLEEQEPVIIGGGVSLEGNNELQAFYWPISLEADSTYLIACGGNVSDILCSDDLFYMDILMDKGGSYICVSSPDWGEENGAFLPNKSDKTPGLSWALLQTGDKPIDDGYFRTVYSGSEGLQVDWLLVYKMP